MIIAPFEKKKTSLTINKKRMTFNDVFLTNNFGCLIYKYKSKFNRRQWV